ncbi:MAG: hypothetical protein HY869_04650 [Chloroflexi bacterium]|nr:hypothetical protein [Chloroflexota bacterium]
MKTDNDNSEQVLLELFDLFAQFGLNPKRITRPGHYPSDRLVIHLTTENRVYVVNFWVIEKELIFETVVAQDISGDPAKIVLFYRWLLELNSTYRKLRYSSADTQKGQVILLRGSESLDKIDASYLVDLTEEIHAIITDDFEVLAGQIGELDTLNSVSQKRTLVAVAENGQEFFLLAGDDTTDAPPPKKQKEK